ncbi:hypothetical protein [Caldisericum sp.]|uniref:hypothetical protein n=1 Tax=Caldisericum sp. TaxID=2499687 RepID=UPI003D12431E
MRRLEGEASFDSTEEIWLNDEHSIYPTFHVFDGCIDDETGWIRLFATFQDFTSEEEDKYFCVIYIDYWQSDNENYKTSKDIETIEDALKVEWIFPMYDVYTLGEKEQFFELLNEYIGDQNEI